MIVLDLDGDDDELVRRMVPQARNKLRKAVRRGVTVSVSRDLERFWGLYTDAMRGSGRPAGTCSRSPTSRPWTRSATAC
jgi:FemAB family.